MEWSFEFFALSAFVAVAGLLLASALARLPEPARTRVFLGGVGLCWLGVAWIGLPAFLVTFGLLPGVGPDAPGLPPVLRAAGHAVPALVAVLFLVGAVRGPWGASTKRGAPNAPAA